MLHKHRSIWTLGFIACMSMLATATPAAAQTGQSFHYVIPRFSSNAGSQLIISNLSSRLVTPTVKLIDAASEQLVEATLPFQPGTEGKLTPASFGLSSFAGSVVIDSSAPLSVLAALGGPGGIETVGPAPSSNTLFVPFSEGTTGNMQLTLFNEESTSTTVVITAVAPNGSNLGLAQRVIPSLTTLTESVSALFPKPASGSPRDISHLVIRVASNVFGASRRVYAHAEMIGFQDTREGILYPFSDFAAVTGMPVASSILSGLLPFFAQGSDYVTLLQVINTANLAGSVTLTAKGPDGNVIAGTEPVRLDLPANGAIRKSLKNIFSLPPGLVIGSVSLESSTPVIATEAIASETQGAFILAPAGPDAATNFVFSIRDFNKDSFTGFTFLNSGGPAARLTLRNISGEGVATSRTTLTVSPNTSLTRSLAELLPEVRKAGLIHVSSDVPIVATALEGRFDNTSLGNLPATHSQPDYTPPDPTEFLVTGTVRHNGVPLSSGILQLSGPVNLATSTDQNGVYFFEKTPPGEYTIRPAATGYTFGPSERKITIVSDSSRDNDFAATLVTPTISAVQPPSVVAGSSDTSLFVVASPITPTTEIVFEGVAVLTTISTAALPVTVAGATGGTVTVIQNVQALKTVLEAAKLAVAHIGSFFIRTNGPGGSASSDAVAFVVGGAAPVLTSMTGVPDPLLIGNPGFTLTVNGTGFTAETVLRVGETALKPTTFLSATQLRAFVGPELLGEGGLLKVTALNPQPTVGPSNALSVSLFNPIPGLTSISPNSTAVRLDPNSLPLELTVNGFGFSKDAVVTIDSTEVPTEYRSSTLLIGSVSQKVLEAAKILVVKAKNPPPTLGTSEALPLSLYNLVPTLRSLDASPLVFDPNPRFKDDKPSFTAQVVIRGTNFTKDGLIYVIGTPCDDDVGGLGGERVSSTLIVGTIKIACLGLYRLGVVNPQPGGGLSELLGFTVSEYTAPTAVSITGLAPAGIVAGGDTFTLTISGSNIAIGAVVNFGTAVLFPASVTSNAIVVTVPSYLVKSSGIVPVSITNPDATGNSNRLLFTLN
ncbi:MAG: hypothetical protein HY646_20730 [Acidobacteria bacterium]|nr:hypothetical protein [Acidobacteriota bacterium]